MLPVTVFLEKVNESSTPNCGFSSFLDTFPPQSSVPPDTPVDCGNIFPEENLPCLEKMIVFEKDPRPPRCEGCSPLFD